MKPHFVKKLAAVALGGALTFSLLAACANNSGPSTPTNTQTPAAPTTTVLQPTSTASQPEAEKQLKYVFLFIGDGMSFPQFQIASDYLGALNQSGDIVTGGENLSFMEFSSVGCATTFDSTSFCPDSASTATSIATGHKTHSGVINMDESKTVTYTTIAEQLHDLGKKVGIISTVNLNHATPAAFYAHQASRSNYYEIGLELIDSGFEYFAGGGLLQPTGKDGSQEDLYALAEQGGYQVVMTQAEAEALTGTDGKTLIIGETLADSSALSYDNDRASEEWALRDYVRKGIELLDNEEGFFMMVEGGKIDWACHANDAGSTIADTIALDEAVKEALEFYYEHPDETLILVTGDHETGGLTIGYAGTNYDTFLTNLENQKISYAKYDSDYVAGYVENGTSFEEAMQDVEDLFGLVTPENAAAAASETLVLTEYEMQRLRDAYALTLAGGTGDDETAEEYVLYGGYEPFSVTITHLLNNKSGINFGSYAHTGLPVAVFAEGNGAELFDSAYDNTEIYVKLAGLLGI